MRGATIFNRGLGGRLSDGKQWMSWVGSDDAVGMLLHAARTESVRGPMNVTSPSPTRNRAFTEALADVVHRRAVLTVPGFALKMTYGDLGDILLASQRALPRVALDTGYTFVHPDLRSGIEAAVYRHRPPQPTGNPKKPA